MKQYLTNRGVEWERRLPGGVDFGRKWCKECHELYQEEESRAIHPQL